MAREMKETGIYNIGRIPLEWSVRRIKNVATIANGKEVESDNGDIPVYGSGGVFKYTSKALFNGVAMLYGRKGTIDKPQLVDGAFWTVDTMFYTSRLIDIFPKFLYYCSVSLIDFPFYKSGSVLPSMTQSELGRVFITFPPLTEQHRIATFLDRKCAEIDSVIANTQRTIEEYKALKQSIITEAVTKGVRGERPMKDSGIEWIGEIPEGWKIYRIANLYEERNENGLSELPILTVSINTGVSDYEIADEDKDRVFARSEDRTKYKRVYPGDLTYNMMRAWQGAFGAVRVDGMVSPAYVVAKPKSNVNIDSRYIEALLRTPIAIEEMHRYSRGIVDFRLRLYWPEFKNIQICLPPFDEQEKIANYIDNKANEIDEIIAKKQKLICEVESYKKSVIYEYVTGKKEAPIT